MKKIKWTFKKIAYLFRFIAAGILFISLFIPFFNGLRCNISGSNINYISSAFTFIFGGSISVDSSEYLVKSNSIIALISYILIITSIIVLVYSFFIRKTQYSYSQIIFFIGFALAIAESIIFLSIRNNIAEIYLTTINNYTESLSSYSLDFGFYGCSIFGFVASFFMLMSIYLDGTIDKIKYSFFSRH